MTFNKTVAFVGTLTFVLALSVGFYAAPAAAIEDTYEVSEDSHLFEGGHYDVLEPTIVAFAAAPNTIDAGQSSTLLWESENTTKCTSPDFDTLDAKSGNAQVTPTETKVYSLFCSGHGGWSERSTTVTVRSASNPDPTPAPEVTLTANPSVIEEGESTTITWSANNATYCRGFYGDKEETYGSIVLSPSATKTYTKTCFGNGGEGSDSVTITVLEKSAPISDPVYTSPPASDPTPPTCTIPAKQGRTIVNFDTSDELYAHRGVTEATNGPVSTSLPTGTYKITLMGWDGSANRLHDVQPHEQYVVKLENNGSLIATSNELSDLQDGVIETSKTEVVNSALVVSSPVNQVTAYHPYYYDRNPNSLTPICAAFDLVVESPRPTCDLDIDPTSIKKGESATLTWSSTNVSSVTIDQGIGSVAPNDDTSVSPTVNTTYTGTFTGTNGDVITCDAKIWVDQPTGSIKVCKAVLDEDGNIVPGNDRDGDFTIEVAGIEVTFSTPLSLAKDFFGNDQEDDTECSVINDLPLGEYQYEQEQITGDSWKAPRYHDNFTIGKSLSDFKVYGEGSWADGIINLTESTPDRILVVLNQYEKKETPPEPPVCPLADREGRVIIDFGSDKRLLSSGTEDRAIDGPISTSLSAGTYDITLVAWDGYIGRETISQPNEKYFVRLENGSGFSFDTDATLDLQDKVREAIISTDVEEGLTLDEAITKVSAVHAVYPDKSNPNSVMPICAAFDREPDPEPPVCTMSIEPGEIEKGDSAILSWTSVNVVSATIDKGIGSVDVTDSMAVSPTEDTTYTGTFVGKNGEEKVCTATVIVKPPTTEPKPPLCTLTADPTSHGVGGGKSTISWTTINSVSGELDQGIGTLDPLSSGDVEVQVDSTTVYTATVIGKDGSTATCTVRIKVDKPGCTNNCGGGGPPFDPHVSLAHRDMPPEGDLAFVYLSQVPYTGFPASPLLATIFWLLVILLSAVVAYIIILNRLPQKVLLAVTNNGPSEDEYPASINFSDGDDNKPNNGTGGYTDYANTYGAQGNNPTQVPVTPAEPQTPTATYNATVAAPSGNGSPSGLIGRLEARAHEENILISTEGINKVIDLGAGSESKCLEMLNKLIEEAKATFPREDGWILLNSERVNTLLATISSGAIPAYVPPVTDTPLADDLAQDDVSSSFAAQTDTQDSVVPPTPTPPLAPQAPTPPAAPVAPVTPDPVDDDQLLSDTEDLIDEDCDTGEEVTDLIACMVKGREEKAFSKLRDTSKDRDLREFFSQIMCVLDEVYKYRLEGGRKPNAQVLKATESWGIKTLEGVLEILADGVDHSYSSPRLSAKVTLAKVFSYLRGNL